MKNILIIDGDVLAFRAAAIAEQRTVEVIHKPSETKKTFKTRTEFKAFLKEKGKEYIEDDYEVTDVQTPLFLEVATNVLDNQVQRFKEALVCSEVHVYLSGKDNFRNSLPLPSKYKGKREDSLRPVHLLACREHFIKNYGAVLAHGHEADDEVIIKGYEVLTKGHKPLVCTVDKDARAYGGIYLFDPTKEEPELKLNDRLGILERTEKAVIGNGFLWYCLQMLIGDITDNYKPTELAKLKFGEVSAFNLLKDCKTEQEALLVVINQYKKWYPTAVVFNDWTGQERVVDYLWLLDIYHKCVRMKEHRKDTLDFSEFCRKIGVTL